MEKQKHRLLPRSLSGWVMFFYFVICFSMVSFPGIYFANRIEPYVLGLPFFFFWCVFWAVIMTPIGLLILYYIEEYKKKNK